VYREFPFQLKRKSEFDDYILEDEEFVNPTALQNLINEEGINEYGTLKYDEDDSIFMDKNNFQYTKLKDIQNMDWAETSVEIGSDYAKNMNFISALQCFDSAIELDPFNTNAYKGKGATLMNQVSLIIKFTRALL
jgi:hypothetical protein